MSRLTPSRRALIAGASLAIAAALLPAKEAAKAGYFPRFRQVVASVIPTVTPKTLAQGGTYTGAASSGYSDAEKANFQAKRGNSIGSISQYGTLAGSKTAGVVGATADQAPPAPILQWANFGTSNVLVTGNSVRVQVAKFCAGPNGIDSEPVKFSCEGNVQMIAAPTAGTMQAWGGVTRKFPLYEIDVLTPDPVNGGIAEVYAEAAPVFDY